MASVVKKQPRLRVGVFGAEASKTYATERGEVVTVGQVAEWLENGTWNAPPREWLAGYVRDNESRIKEMIKRAAEQVASGRMTAEQALNLVGLKVKGEIQARIASGALQPANADSTIKRKGSSVPGIDSGQFRASIGAEVVS
jgi:hypothetical protein